MTACSGLRLTAAVTGPKSGDMKIYSINRVGEEIKKTAKLFGHRKD